MWSSIASILVGFFLRVSLDYRDGKLTLKLFITQGIFSLALSYFFYLIRRDYKWTMSLDLMFFIISFFASFIVTLFDKFGKFGIRNYFLMFIRRYAAEAELDETKETKHDTDTKLDRSE